MNGRSFRGIVIGVGILLIGVVLGLGAAVAFAAPERVPSLAPAGTAFTYQGFLTESGVPADGLFDFEFYLYDDALAGAQVGSTSTLQDVMVTDGTFTVDFDFGDVFDGTAMWLEIRVREGASTGGYQQLLPRQPLTPVPYASYALNVPLAGNGSAETAARSDHYHPAYLTTESDPQVDYVSTAGKWCRSDGSAVLCDQTGAGAVTKHAMFGAADIAVYGKAFGLIVWEYGNSHVSFPDTTSGTFHLPTHLPIGAQVTEIYCRARDDEGGVIKMSFFPLTAQCGSTTASDNSGFQDLVISDCSATIGIYSKGAPIEFTIESHTLEPRLLYCTVTYSMYGY
jgi:hypothetical protein